jgi:hypothetical protein
MGTNTIISDMFAQMANALASQDAATKGHRFAASPNVYQSGGRHPHNHISSKEVGANHFKILAYRKAAKVLSDYPVDVAEAYGTGGIKALTAIPGIGAALSKKIAEFIETGHMKKYEELIAQKPKGE